MPQNLKNRIPAQVLVELPDISGAVIFFTGIQLPKIDPPPHIQIRCHYDPVIVGVSRERKITDAICGGFIVRPDNTPGQIHSLIFFFQKRKI